MAHDVWQAGSAALLTELTTTDEEVRGRVPDPAVAAAVRQPGLSLAEVVDTVVRAYADRTAVREWRRSEHGVVETSLTYGRLWGEARSLVSGWRSSGTGPGPGELVCSLGGGSTGYAVLELASIVAGTVSVPLAPTSSLGRWRDLLDDTRPALLVVDADRLEDVVPVLLDGGVRPRAVQVLGNPRWLEAHTAREGFDTAARRLRDAGVELELLDDVLARGRRLPPAPVPGPSAGAPPAAQVIYTSGATGVPKGAVFTTAHLAALWIGQAQSSMPAIVTHYMPMSHVAGRMVLTGALARGGLCSFTQGSDPALLWEDVARTRPTEFFLIPRICELVRDTYRTQVAASVAEGTDRGEAEARVRKHLREDVLGGRIVSAVNGSAPLDADLRAFLESVLQVPVHDAYGSTEAGGVVLFDNRVQRPPVLDYKLVDVPELGYHTTDRPHPRGELLVRTTSMVPGYLGRPELDAEVFNDEGFYRTGDVMAQTGPDELHFVERRNNVLKLSQAEFVAVARLEALYADSPQVHQVFLHGRSGWSSLLAVVVPSPAALAEHTGDDLRAAVLRGLQEQAAAVGLQPFEVPRDVLVETTPFSVENGLLSGIAKPLRPELVRRYAGALEELHEELEAAVERRTADLYRLAGVRPVLDTVRDAAAAVLGGPPSSLDVPFARLGGDSLAAYELATRLSDVFTVDVPVSVVLSPANGLRQLAAHVDAARSAPGRTADGPQGRGSRATAGTVHPEPGRLSAGDLTLERFLPDDHLAAAPGLPAAGGPPVYLLTGANGFLGRFLALELLERVERAPGTGGRVVALVRGRDAADARARLLAAVAGDAMLEARFARLAADHLEVVVGDVGHDRLGVGDAVWRRLSAQVTDVVHAGALVNHVLPYEQLFASNVAGTAEVVRLATTTTRKHVVYVSTVGIADQVPAPTLAESADVRTVSPERIVCDAYANGYANTKWASEVLLRTAHETCEVPVTVFRSNLVMAHRTAVGQLNLPDVFTRLLLTVLVTGLAPTTFAGPGPEGTAGPRDAGDLDGLPVDFVASAVVALGEGGQGYRTFNAVGNRASRTSLDTVVDWLVDAGHEVVRVADQAEWLRRSEIALRVLPREVGRRTLLPVLSAFSEVNPLPSLDVPSSAFAAAVEERRVAGVVPEVDRALVEKYVRDLQALALVEAPSPGPAVAPAAWTTTDPRPLTPAGLDRT